MKLNQLSVLLKVFCLIGCFFVISFKSLAADFPKATTFEELAAQIEALLEDGDVPGASIVVIEDGDVKYHRHFGVSNLESGKAVSDATVFRAGSISKSFTSVAAIMLTEQKKLDLNAPISAYLPDLTIDNPWHKTDPVRVVHLLEHTAGLNDIAYRHYLMSGAQYSVGDAVNLYQPYLSRWRPGTRTSYSNSGPVIVGHIIEIVSGQTFESYTENTLFSPLGMDNTRWTLTPDISDRISKSYYGNSDKEEPFVEIPGRPGGSLNTTALELAQLPRLMLGRGTLEGQTYFSPESAQRIESPQSNDAVRAGLKYGYGLGNVANTNGKAVFFGHDGSIDGFSASFAYAPKLNSGFVVMLNRTSPKISDITANIRSYLERDLTPPVLSAVKLDNQLKVRWSGQYKTVVPRRAFLKPMIGVGHWEGLKFYEGHARFKGKDYKYLGENLFQAKDESAPSLVVIDDAEGIRLQSGQSTYHHMPQTIVWANALAIILISIGLILTAVNILAWILGLFVKKLKSQSTFIDRGMPAAALLLAVTAFIFPIAVSGSGNFERVGTQNPWSWAVFAFSIIAPIAAGLALWRVLVSKAPKLSRTLAVFQTALALMICIYLFHNGWFALKIWNA